MLSTIIKCQDAQNTVIAYIGGGEWGPPFHCKSYFESEKRYIN